VSSRTCTGGKLLSVRASEVRHREVLPRLRGLVLDVGCGNNQLLKGWQGRGWGIDSYAWRGVDVVGDAVRLPFQAQTFDTVVYMACLNHIPDRVAALREAHRVLRADGQLLITMIGPVVGWIWHRLPWRQREEDERGMLPGETFGLSMAAVRRYLAEAGFALCSRRRFGPLGLNNLYLARKQP